MVKFAAIVGLACAPLFSGYMVGWIHAHQTVATECQRLGGFYVGKATFKCAAEPAKTGGA